MKPYYYTFEWKDRVITLCLIEDYDKLNKQWINIGYSIKIPKDTMDEELSKIIAFGRTKKSKTRLSTLAGYSHYCKIINDEIRQDKGVLKAIAKNCERNIKNGTIVIKGIR